MCRTICSPGKHRPFVFVAFAFRNNTALQSKLCSSSRRISCRIVSATLKPNRLVLAQTQEYKLRWIGSKKVRNIGTITCNCIVLSWNP